MELVLAVLVALSLLGVAYYYIESRGLSSPGEGGGVATISTTGMRCDDASLPQTAQKAQQDPRFTALSDGRCYNYFGESQSPGGNGSILTFVYYNGTITYPCGTSAQQLPESEIQVAVAGSGAVVSVQTASPTGFERDTSCDPSVPIKVVSIVDVESTIPAVPQLNLTLAAGVGVRPITSLRAVLTLDGGAQVFQFNAVSAAKPLMTPNSTSLTEIVLSGISFSSNEVYPMTISGTFDNGQAFSNVVHVQIANVP